MEETNDVNVKSTYPIIEESKCSSCSPLIFVYLLSASSMISAIGIIVWWVYHADNSGVSVEIVSRTTWGAKYVEPHYLHHLKVNPPTHVVIMQSDSTECYSLQECSDLLKAFQKKDIQEHRYDISSNFLIGNDGLVYEGRGWGMAGVYASRIQDKAVGIEVIGNFDNDQPSGKVLKVCQLLIEESVRRKKLYPNYKLIGINQVTSLTPGKKLFDAIKTWKHWEDCRLKEC